MYKRSFLVMIDIFLIVLVSLALSSFSVRAARTDASDFYQRHSNWTGLAQTSAAYHLDCFRRELHLKVPDVSKQDASNYYLNLS